MNEKDHKKPKFGGAHANEVTDDFVFAGIDDTPKMAFALLMADSWLADSACTSHMPERSYFTDYTPTSGHFGKGLGNQPLLGMRTVKLTFRVDGKDYPITLNNLLHVPNAPHNLILLGQVTGAKIQVLFTDTDVKFRTPNRTIMAQGTEILDLYLMDVKVLAKQDHAYSAKAKVNVHTWDKWHRILGHLNMASIK